MALTAGVHLSISGGINNIFIEAERLGINCFQLFLGSPRVWSVKRPSQKDIAVFIDRSRPYEFICVHAPYLLNFATPDETLFQRSIQRAIVDMNIMAALGITYYVVHPGTHADVRAGIERIRSAMQAVFDAVPRGVMLIENTAGERNDIGVTLDELAEITAGFGKRTGICIDTCHMFASGIDIRQPQDVEALYHDLTSRELLSKLVMFHANDSRYDLSARHDRHTHIGQGAIGDKGFHNLLTHAVFGKLPFILETPKEEDMDAVNLKRLRTLAR